MSKRTTEQERTFARYNWLSAVEAARQLGGMSSEQVIALYDAGELTGFEAHSPGAKKRDIRFRQEWVDACMERRTKHAAA
jgi:hypothetical protein